MLFTQNMEDVMATTHTYTDSHIADRYSARVHSLLTDRVHGRAAVPTAVARVAAGVVFMLASVPKFPFAGSAHANEMALFVRVGFPNSATLLVLVGLLELVGGLMLVAGLGTRIVAFGLALDMAGAIATAGVQVGGPIHLGLAPTLLAVMLYLLWAGPGSRALDHHITRHP
jgi:putative oxidoreductase